MRRIVLLMAIFAFGAQGLCARGPATPYLSASSKKARCAALANWYAKTIEVAGGDAFSPHVHVDQLQKKTARGFGDDLFVPAIGQPYNELTSSQRKKIHGDIGSCSMAPVDDIMRDYMQSAFSDDTRYSMVRGWRSAIPAAQRVAADAASFRNGQSLSTAPPSSAARGFVPFAQAATKEQRCTALQKWYERAVELTGPETFGRVGVYSNDVMTSLARAFQDDIFPTYFGEKYRDLQPARMPQMRDDVLTCNTPAVGQWAQLVSSAFLWGRNGRDAWLKPINAQAAQLAQMRYASISVRASMAEIAPPPGKAPGPHDRSNRGYSRIIYSDDRVTVGAADLVSGKCLDSIQYVVGIDLDPSEPITPGIAKGVIDRVLSPLAQRECPGADLTIFARFFSRTLSATHRGRIVPAGSEAITGEIELAAVSYGSGHRRQNAMPTMNYGGINYGYPELASLEGIADYATRGGRDPVKVAASAPKVTKRYVNYKPSEPPLALAAFQHARLYQQLIDHDFFGIYLDPANSPYIDMENPGVTGAVSLLAGLIGGLKKLDPLGSDSIPPRRGFPYAIEAFSEACRASLGPNPATYTPVWGEKVGEDVEEGLFATIVTEHWETRVGKTVFMEPAHRALYADAVATEKSIIMRDILKLRDQLGLEQLLAGEASTRPFIPIMKFQADAAGFMQLQGCERGKQLLRNWAEFLNGPKPQARPRGDYPMVVEHKKGREGGPDEVMVAIGDVPASEAPLYPYTDGMLLMVEYYGDRRGGVLGYQASHFHLAYLPVRLTQQLMRAEHDELLRSFRADRIRMLTCFYGEGQVNYWLEGHPQPNEQQRKLVETAFRGTAARCPARWPG